MALDKSKTIFKLPLHTVGGGLRWCCSSVCQSHISTFYAFGRGRRCSVLQPFIYLSLRPILAITLNELLLFVDGVSIRNWAQLGAIDFLSS